MALNPDHFRAYKLMGGLVEAEVYTGVGRVSEGRRLLVRGAGQRRSRARRQLANRSATHHHAAAHSATHSCPPDPGSALYALGDFEGAKAALKESLR